MFDRCITDAVRKIVRDEIEITVNDIIQETLAKYLQEWVSQMGVQIHADLEEAERENTRRFNSLGYELDSNYQDLQEDIAVVKENVARLEVVLGGLANVLTKGGYHE